MKKKDDDDDEFHVVRSNVREYVSMRAERGGDCDEEIPVKVVGEAGNNENEGHDEVEEVDSAIEVYGAEDDKVQYGRRVVVDSDGHDDEINSDEDCDGKVP